MQKRNRALPFARIPLLLVVVATLSVPACAGDTPDHIGQAEEAFKARDFAAAKVSYQEFYNQRGEINNTPGQQVLNLRVMLQLGRCCRELSQFPEARDWYNLAISKGSTFPTSKPHRALLADAQYEIGVAYARQGLNFLALDAFEQVVTDYPSNRNMCGYALLGKARVDMIPGRYPEAVKTLRRLLTEYSDKKVGTKWFLAGMWLLARALDESFRTDEALAVLEDVYNDPAFTRDERGTALVRMANAQLRADRLSDCIATCERLSREYGNSKWHATEAKLMLLQAQVGSGRKADASLLLIKELREIRWYRDRQAQFAMWEGGCHWMKGDLEEAERSFSDAIVQSGNRATAAAEAYYHRALFRIHALHDFGSAASDIENISIPHLQHFARAEQYYFEGKCDQAATEYELVIETLPEYRVPNTEPIQAYKRLANCYSKLGRQNLAEEVREQLAAFELAHK